MTIERVGVVGGGIMGSGIAEACARAGCHVVVREPEERLLAAAEGRIRASIERAVERGKLEKQGCEEALRRLRFSTELAELADVDLVVEAVSEQADLKRQLFAALDEIVPAGALLCSNTSSIPIAQLAAATGRPGSVLGMHFFNPVPVMPLVELVPSIRTEPETLERAERFVTDILQKRVIHARDRAGFIVNTLLVPYLLSAIRMFEAGFATAEDIDTGMELGCNHPMGPLKLSDFIGLDTVALIADSLLGEFSDSVYVTPPLLRRMIDAGLLGKKSGRGFYDYGADGRMARN